MSDLGEVVSETVERIVETAEGNPLFVEQLVATLAEDGADLEVPPTLQALLTARIDRLADSERAVIERGSVEGRLFHRGAVAALLPEPDRGGRTAADADAQGAHPSRSRWCRATTASGSVTPSSATPRTTRSKRVRALLHEAYAQWLDSKLGDDAPDEIVGYHLERTYRYGAELGAADPVVGERAAERLATAGQAAHARRDMHAAVNLLGRAADLQYPVNLGDLPCSPSSATPYTQAARSNARVRCSRRRRLWRPRQVTDTWSGSRGIELAATQLDTESGDPEAAFREGMAAIAAREPADDHDVLARAWDLIATTHNWRSQAAEWQRASEKAASHARETGDLALEVRTATKGPSPSFADDLTARLGHVPEVQGFAAHVRSHMRARLGQFDGAFEGANAWRHHIHELGQEIMYARTASCVWDVCSWARDWEHGEEVLRESYEMFERMGMHTHRSTVAAHLGEAVFGQGRVEEAQRLSVESEELGASDDLFNEMSWMRLRAKVAAAHDEPDQARALAKRAVEPPRVSASSTRSPWRGSTSPESSWPRATRKLDPPRPRRSVCSSARATWSARTGHASSSTRSRTTRSAYGQAVKLAKDTLSRWIRPRSR